MLQLLEPHTKHIHSLWLRSLSAYLLLRNARHSNNPSSNMSWQRSSTLQCFTPCHALRFVAFRSGITLLQVLLCSVHLLKPITKTLSHLLYSIMKDNVHYPSFLCRQVSNDTMYHCPYSRFFYASRLKTASHSCFPCQLTAESLHSIIYNYYASCTRPLSLCFQPQAIQQITEDNVLSRMFLWSYGEPDEYI